MITIKDIGVCTRKNPSQKQKLVGTRRLAALVPLVCRCIHTWLNSNRITGGGFNRIRRLFERFAGDDAIDIFKKRSKQTRRQWLNDEMLTCKDGLEGTLDIRSVQR